MRIEKAIDDGLGIPFQKEDISVEKLLFPFRDELLANSLPDILDVFLERG